jgi:ureidoglycolate lyase
LTAEPLSAAAFAAFGSVLELDAKAPRRGHVAGAVERSADAVEPQLWIATVAEPVALPFEVTQLERHPFSAQTFIPLNGSGYLVLVCESSASGAPELTTLRLFEASARQGVTYRRNVWHGGLAVLRPDAQFVVSMSFTGRGDDDEFLPLERPIALLAQPA